MFEELKTNYFYDVIAERNVLNEWMITDKETYLIRIKVRNKYPAMSRLNTENVSICHLVKDKEKYLFKNIRNRFPNQNSSEISFLLDFVVTNFRVFFLLFSSSFN